MLLCQSLAHSIISPREGADISPLLAVVSIIFNNAAKMPLSDFTVEGRGYTLYVSHPPLSSVKADPCYNSHTDS